jgi:hypothetical protein
LPAPPSSGPPRLRAAGLRLGLYNPIKTAVVGVAGPAGSGGGGGGQERVPVGLKIAAGSLSGGLAAALSSPTELIKVGAGAGACWLMLVLLMLMLMLLMLMLLGLA